MKKISLFLLTMFLRLLVTGQQLPLQKLFFTDDHSLLKATVITPTFDSSYIVLGSLINKQLFATKIDDYFNIVWSRKYSSEPKMMDFTRVIQCHDSTFAATGQDSLGNICVLKLDANGDVIWAKKISCDVALRTNITETIDHGFIILAHGEDIDHSAKTTSVINISLEGNVRWGKKITGYDRFVADAMAGLPNKQTLIAGNGGTILHYTDPLLFVLDSNGNISWAKILNWSDDTRFLSMTIRNSSAIYLTTDGLLCSDFSGNVVWAKQQCPSGSSYSGVLGIPPLITKESDGGFIYVLQSESRFIKTDSSGEVLFNKKMMVAVNGLVDFHNGYVVLGVGPYARSLGNHFGISRTNSSGQTSKCLQDGPPISTSPINVSLQPANLVLNDYLPEVSDIPVTSQAYSLQSADLCIHRVDVENIETVIPSLSVTPNPVVYQSIIKITGSEQNSHNLTLYDCSGKIVLNDSYKGDTYLFSKGSLNTGIYLLVISDKKGIQTYKKIMIF